MLKKIIPSFLLLIIVIVPLLTQTGNASNVFRVHVWLSDIKEDTGLIQLCLDTLQEYYSICKYVNGNATKDSIKVGKVGFTNAADGGTYDIPITSAPIKSTVLVCAYAFKYENGVCEKVLNKGNDMAVNVLLRINYSMVFYDNEEKRPYMYGENYISKSGTTFSFEHEEVVIPSSNNDSK